MLVTALIYFFCDLIETSYVRYLYKEIIMNNEIASAMAKVFFLPKATRPSNLPPLSLQCTYWHTGIIYNGRVWETFNNGRNAVTSSATRIFELSEQKAEYVNVRIYPEKLESEINSGTSCEQFVLRVTGHSPLTGSNKGEYFPDDVHQLLLDTNTGHNEVLQPSTEASAIKTKKEKIIEYLVSYLNKIDKSGKNADRYYKLLSAMSDTAFDQFMHLVKEGKYQFHLMVPNMEIHINIDDLMIVAKELKVEIFHQLWMKDEITGKRYLTPESYPVLQIPIRRAQQFLDKKISVPDSDRSIDGLTGQVIGDDRATTFSNPEIQIMYARGLTTTLQEFLRVRGGDINAYGEFKRQMEETGSASLAKLDPSNRTRVAVITSL